MTNGIWVPDRHHGFQSLHESFHSVSFTGMLHQTSLQLVRLSNLAPAEFFINFRLLLALPLDSQSPQRQKAP